MESLNSIVKQFAISEEVKNISPLGGGFINSTYLVETSSEKEYILQHKNSNIFTDVPAMMENISLISEHLKEKALKRKEDIDMTVYQIVRTKDGKGCFIDSQKRHWALSPFIRDSDVFERVTFDDLALNGGKAMAAFHNDLADFNHNLVDILPGFHNIRYRFEQFNEVVLHNPKSRNIEMEEQISWIYSRKVKMLEFYKKIENGSIPTRVAHNDTKISNILFNKDKSYRCMIDLDTVQRATILNDFGDAMRTYTNTGSEDDTNLNNISMDMNKFKLLAKGYLTNAIHFLTPLEIEYLAFSGIYITYEQVLRFLMDYLQGDTYYKIKSPMHNVERTLAQYKLLTSMESQLSEMNNYITSLVKELKK